MDVAAGLFDLLKELGKGGGGSTEEPTVCISLLPVALGLMFVGWRTFRRRAVAPVK